ncbi:MAG: NAD(P)/FAD-dependent oxidoreductase [Clostridiaceae bacterium]|uniref:NAD(P)/FAD-dependent oxidoreductase n=1 Tax=Clostridium porci TaxID=2605778 RepID=A0A7X2NI07_9CLOT|nr:MULTISPECIES: NAD(P)/FAD-dependent oxidoreductase [Clostridium]MCI6139457.1 NAD(P)/FAD-dependent oxidoreductase [Clostridium sp.]MDY3231725.1 NAD(P)/FAD-dependent oxidoreductase [Clostridiaceae bacterium]MSS35202.1 NAD(P)/FAD-dependent oxidoreductase [Clostridium porci]
MSKTKEIIIVGGGAAGMIASVAAAREGARVRLFEKNEKLGKKLFITGKGRCNITNACDMEELLASVVSNSKFLFSSFYGFTNQNMMELLESQGVHLKVERGSRVFPRSDKSSDVIAALASLMKKEGVEIQLQAEAHGLVIQDKAVRGIRLGSQVEKADRVIVTTGGLSYPTTGSTGDGYRWAQECGHQITDLSPALVPFVTAEADTVKDLQGLALRNVETSVYSGKRELYREMGEMLFTHFGVSGPLILSASSFCAKALKKGPLRLLIDLKPALSEEQLNGRVLRDFEESKNKQFKNSLGRLYPARLIPVIIARSGIDQDKQVNEITKEERRRLVQITKGLEFTVTGLRDYKEAIITQGGISVRDIHPGTMESKRIAGLYFAGEILDLDAVTGGYNLQIAWSTGWAAGKGAAG